MNRRKPARVRRLAFGASALALAMGGLVAIATPAGAAKIPVGNAVGHVTCSITGKVKFSPALSSVNTLPVLTTAKIKGTCTGDTQSALVEPIKMKATVTSPGGMPTCNALLVPGTADFIVDVTWKASGGTLNPSHIVFPGITPAGLSFNLGAGNTTGSYAGTMNATAIANVAVPDLTKCNPGPPPKNKPPKGLKKLTVSSGSISVSNDT